MTGSESWDLLFSGCNWTLEIAAGACQDYSGENSDDPACRHFGRAFHYVVARVEYQVLEHETT